MVLEYLESEKVREALGMGLDYGKKKLDEYLKSKYKAEEDILKHRLEGEKNVLINNLKIREAIDRAELDKQRDFYKGKAKASYEDELTKINLGAVEKLKNLGYGFDEARDFLKITRASKNIYDPVSFGSQKEKVKKVKDEDRGTGGTFKMLPKRPIVLPKAPKKELRETKIAMKTNLPESGKPTKQKKKKKPTKKK
jgi:hypothetical protein